MTHLRFNFVRYLTKNIKNSFNFVGITFERYLNWHDHVTVLVSSATKKFGVLFRGRNYPSPTNLYILYVSHVRSSLEYCSRISDLLSQRLAIYWILLLNPGRSTRCSCRMHPCTVQLQKSPTSPSNLQSFGNRLEQHSSLQVIAVLQYFCLRG